MAPIETSIDCLINSVRAAVAYLWGLDCVRPCDRPYSKRAVQSILLQCMIQFVQFKMRNCAVQNLKDRREIVQKIYN